MHCILIGNPLIPVLLIPFPGESFVEDLSEICWGFVLAGACAVQFGSVLGEHWTEVFADINSGIQNYMEQNGYSSIGEMVGQAKES